jgi:hypothetical protein
MAPGALYIILVWLWKCYLFDMVFVLYVLLAAVVALACGVEAEWISR